MSDGADAKKKKSKKSAPKSRSTKRAPAKTARATTPALEATLEPKREARDVAKQIRALEERVDRMIEERKSTRELPSSPSLPELPASPPSRSSVAPPAPASSRPSVPPPPVSRPQIPPPAGSRPTLIPGPTASRPQLPSDGESTVFDTARELLSTDFYLRRWGRLGMRNRSEEVDDFGYDPVYDEKVRPLLDFLYERYFRVVVEGADRVPAEGRCLLVANHSGTLPLDGVMLRQAVKREHPAKREVRWLTEDFIHHLPFLGAVNNRLGAVRACQENAERLLQQDALVAVFPEGVKGIGKLFRERYRLQRFGRGGFIKLCLRTRTPIVPVAVLGSEETNPLLFRSELFAKALGIPYVPVTATFPLLGPAGLMPAPTKWKIFFGERIDFEGYGPESADDEILVGRLAERVRATIQGMLDSALGERRSVWFG